MSTLTHPTEREAFRQTVAEVAAKAKAILPASVNGRVEAAVKLVPAGDVEPQEDGSIRVGSSDPERWYHLVGQACECADFTQGKAPQGCCKHRIAAGIQKRVREIEAARPQAAQPVQSPAPLPEAPASLNLKVLIGGHETQITLRDSDEARLLDRLHALLKRQDLRPIPKPAPRSGGWQHRKQGRS